MLTLFSGWLRAHEQGVASMLGRSLGQTLQHVGPQGKFAAGFFSKYGTDHQKTGNESNE